MNINTHTHCDVNKNNNHTSYSGLEGDPSPRVILIGPEQSVASLYSHWSAQPVCLKYKSCTSPDALISLSANFPKILSLKIFTRTTYRATSQLELNTPDAIARDKYARLNEVKLFYIDVY